MAREHYEQNTVNQIKKGTILRGTWGYNRTINEYCKVLKNTGKSLVCQKLAKKSLGYGAGGESVRPEKSISVAKPFRIKIDKYDYGGQPQLSLKGSMPLNSSGSEKQKVYWGKYNGEADIDTDD